MKNKKLRSGKSKKWLYAVLAIALIVCSGGGVYLLTNKSEFVPPEATPGESLVDTSHEESAQKQKFIESGAGSNPTSGETGSNGARSIELTASDSGDGNITALTKLYGYSNGICTLTSTNIDKSDIQEAEVIYEREFSSCAGFNIEKSKLGAGSWKILLSVSNNGSVQTKEIELEVRA